MRPGSDAYHISAASSGGPRYDVSLTPAQRRDGTNGIWLCQNCAHRIDSDVSRYPVETLRRWKDEAVRHAFRDLSDGGPRLRLGPKTFERDDADQEFLSGLALGSEDTAESVTTRLIEAASRDLATFRDSKSWPSHTLALKLSVKSEGEDLSITSAGIAGSVCTVETINFVSDPGTGKTTTLTQVGESLLEAGVIVPALVPLGEWSDRSQDFFTFLCGRFAFSAFRPQHFMQAAFNGQLALLLDGWNELSGAAALRAIHLLDQLKRDYPLLGFIFSSRAHNLPFSGATVRIYPLSQDQQLELGRAVQGEAGATVVERAWRTPGLAELLSVPLYLNALLAAPGATFPETKEEVLRLFVEAHMRAPARAQELRNELSGWHHEYLVGLAVEANRTGNTLIGSTEARRAITAVGQRLVKDGQLDLRPNPTHVLDVLANTLMLVKAQAADAGVLFQHQQFQEWYASFFVEKLMRLSDRGDEESRRRLRFDVLNWPSWEESILFACERLSRSGPEGALSVAGAILDAIEIDPMLAAEMVYRSSSNTWIQVRDKAIAFAEAWHQKGKVDRAVRFMIQTGRSEFATQIWLLIESPDDSTYMRALGAAPRFRSSVLGPDAKVRLSRLGDGVRGHVLAEIGYQSGFEGIELVTSLALADTNPAVVAEVLDALQFRFAERQVAQILRHASDAVWERFVQKNNPDDLVDPELSQRLSQMRQSEMSESGDFIRNIYRTCQESKSEEPGRRVRTLIESSEFPMLTEHAAGAVEQAFQRYPAETAAALLHRLERGLEMPFRAEHFLEGIVAVDEGPIVRMAMDHMNRETNPEDRKGHIALGVVGAKTVGTMLEDLFSRDDQGHGDISRGTSPERKAYFALQDAIRATRSDSFFGALLPRIETNRLGRIKLLANLIAHHGDPYEPTQRHIPERAKATLTPIIEQWLSILLNSQEADRHDFVEVVRLVTRMPDPRFVHGLAQMLERDITDFAKAREDRARSPTPGPIPYNASVNHFLQYQRALAAIGGQTVVALMYRYLRRATFERSAAITLLEIWNKEHLTGQDTRRNPYHDFSQARPLRSKRVSGFELPTCEYSEEIFKVVRDHGRSDRSELEQRMAIGMAVTALAMPHGCKRAEIDALLALPVPFSAKRYLLTAAAIAGEVISSEMLLAAMRDLLEVSTREPWRLMDSQGELSGWLELFPFCDRPETVVAALEMLPDQHRGLRQRRELFQALAHSPDDGGLRALVSLGRHEPQVINEYEWLNALVSLESEAAAQTLLDLIIDGSLTSGPRGGDTGRLSQHLGRAASRFPNIRNELRQRYLELPQGLAKNLIENVLAERADVDTVFMLLQGYTADNRSYGDPLKKAVSNLAVGRRPVDGFSGAYELFGRPLVHLRKELFAMTSGAEPLASLAQQCLLTIEKARDEHGRLEGEPRHPDIESGRPWPSVSRAPEVSCE